MFWTSVYGVPTRCCNRSIAALSSHQGEAYREEDLVENSENDVIERLHAVETAQAVQTAVAAGADATQAAVQAGAATTNAATHAGAATTNAATHAGTWSTMAAGAAGLVAGIFLGLAISRK